MSAAVWRVILCGGLIVTISLGVRSTMGLFIRPMSMDLEIGRGAVGFGIAIANLLWGLSAPFLGAVADKFGAARTTILGALIYAVGLVLLGLSGSADGVWLANVVMGVGATGAGLSIALGAVGKIAPPERRTMALGLVSAAGSVGQFAFAPIASSLIDAFDWRIALYALAGATVLMVPLAFGIATPAGSAAAGPRQSIRAALAEASATPSFWLLTAGFFVCGFHVVFVSTHLPGYIAQQNLPSWVGAWALALIGLFNIVGTIGCGWLGQRYLRKNVLATLYLLRSAVILTFLYVPVTPASVLVFASAFGLLYLGTVPLTSGLVAVMFGPAFMTMLFGIVLLSHQVGSFLGAWLGGLAFDHLGSYDAMWWISVALGVIAALLNWPITEHPVRRAPAVAAAE